ncbi:MAE_28990/MAE_18760 family HEPN-like nuclease [Bacillus infantis]|uniref:RiboL-PSP-HEPN domain-containing protein n=1 Tax=Bacillus infantis TaxID=324767 RepID=A0A5D4R7Q4_9BACI|nr:MAE_28990/MAE_18760 family HEPN-like nuclease [Bacillus infantis]TYS45622.1 hypothetical protein FZD51_18775 [Bacillus infantis]
MRYSYNQFEVEIKRLRDYIQEINNHGTLLTKIIKFEKEGKDSSVEELVLETKQLLIDYYKKENKVFTYNSIIVSLYGLLESFIENLIKEYIDYLSQSIPNYNDLPEPIKNNHYLFSADLINNLSLPKYKDKITKELIVSNLYSCSNCKGLKNYTLNIEAFTQHNYNFRDQTINAFFSAVGVSNITSLLLSFQQFKDYLDNEDIRPEEAFKLLNDLAERRNRVAHGTEENDILDLEQLSRYVDYIEKLANCLNEVIAIQAIPHLVQSGDNITLLGQPLRIFSDKTLGIELEGVIISKGSTLFLMREDGKYSSTVINSIQINNDEFTDIDATKEKFQVAINISKKIKETDIVYLVNKC